MSGPASIRPLSPRERDIAKLLAEGYTPQEIATRFAMTVNAVRCSMHRATTKLTGRGKPTALLIRWALTEGRAA